MLLGALRPQTQACRLESKRSSSCPQKGWYPVHLCDQDFNSPGILSRNFFSQTLSCCIQASQKLQNKVAKNGFWAFWGNAYKKSSAFNPWRQVEVPRAASCYATKQLSVIWLRDQTIQEATRAILEGIYKLLFWEHAHSFRPGVHSALRYIKKTWRGVSWFLQFSIQKSEDMTLMQRQLMRVLSERIEDKCFMDIFEAHVQSRNCMYGHFCRWGDSSRKPSVPDYGEH